MCITFLFTNPGISSVKYKLVLINNRDEDYARKTENAALNSVEKLHTVYGTDLAGLVKGTWLGISSNNGTIRVGNLANVTGEEHRGKLGRGPIVTSFIKNVETSFETFNEDLLSSSQEFSSFNFLSVEINASDIKSVYVSNSPSVLHNVELGFTGLGNSPLKAPFKKVEAGTELFKEVLERNKNESKENLLQDLMAVLKDRRRYFPDEELTSRRQETAEDFSSIHVEIPNDYGTRTRTVILVDNDNNVDYIEETMTTLDPNGEWTRTWIQIPKDGSVAAQL